MAAAWTEEDQKALLAMIEAGVSAQRIAARLKPPLHSIKRTRQGIWQAISLRAGSQAVAVEIIEPVQVMPKQTCGNLRFFPLS